jgi:uncharacterized protein
MATSMNLTLPCGRRDILRGSLLALAGIGTQSLASALAAPMAMTAVYAAIARRRDDTFSVLLLSAAGTIVREIPLSARGHDIAVHAPTGRCVAFARRPGAFAVVFSLHDVNEPTLFEAQIGRHFFGHGAFSADGTTLYVSENNIAEGIGAIGIYDVQRGYKKTGEVPSFGIGPHEIILLSDGRTLAVANGGLDTSPDGGGRENLNTETMAPNLAFIDTQSGHLLGRSDVPPSAQKLSLRHIVEDTRGRIWFGGQWQGNTGDEPGLVGFADRSGKLELSAPEATTTFRGYIGSVALSRDGRVFAASAPKGGAILYIDTETKKLISTAKLPDACGLAAGTSETTLAETSGFGLFRQTSAGDNATMSTQLADIAFDNHLRRLI